MDSPKLAPHQYTKGLNGQKILLVGVFPPPMGGIAVHLQRVRSRLMSQECSVWSWDPTAPRGCGCRASVPFLVWWVGQILYYLGLLRFCLQKRPQIMFYHTLPLRSTPLELCVLIISSWLVGAKLRVVIHSGRFVDQIGHLHGRLLGALLRFCSQIILMGPQLRAQLAAKIQLPVNTVVESPFLPPDFSQKELLLAKTPSDLRSFMASHYPLITVSVTRLDTWQGQDMYGVDLAQIAFESLRKDFPNAGLLIVLGSRNRQNLAIHANTYLLAEWPFEMWPLIGKSDLFVRPARTDSFGISVAEALCQGVSAIASDVCPRPEGTILFRSGDAQDLYVKMLVQLKRSSLEGNKG